jgi:hypothetical protein
MAHARIEIFATTLEKGKAFMGRTTDNMVGNYGVEDTIAEGDGIAMKDDGVLEVEPIL